MRKSKGNSYIHKDGYYIGYTTQGEEFYIDDDDYDLVKQYTWVNNGQGYLTANINKKKIRLHRFIANANIYQQVDHINHNRMDNRKINLRLCDNKSNSRNKIAVKNNRTGVLGVSKYNASNKFAAKIDYNHKTYFLGFYNTIQEAMIVRIFAENLIFGSFCSRPVEFINGVDVVKDHLQRFYPIAYKNIIKALS